MQGGDQSAMSVVEVGAVLVGLSFPQLENRSGAPAFLQAFLLDACLPCGGPLTAKRTRFTERGNCGTMCHMNTRKEISIRDLHERTGALVREAAAGHYAVIITDRGRPVATMTPFIDGKLHSLNHRPPKFWPSLTPTAPTVSGRLFQSVQP